MQMHYFPFIFFTMMMLASQLGQWASWMKLATRSLFTSSSMAFCLFGAKFLFFYWTDLNFGSIFSYGWLSQEEFLACLILTKQRYPKSKSWSQSGSSKEALICTDFVGSSFSGKDSSLSVNSPLFSSSSYSSVWWSMSRRLWCLRCHLEALSSQLLIPVYLADSMHCLEMDQKMLGGDNSFQ